MANFRTNSTSKQPGSRSKNKMVRQKPFLNIGGKVKDLVWWAEGPNIYCADENTDQIHVLCPRVLAERLAAERARIDAITPELERLYSVSKTQQHAWVDDMAIEVLVPAYQALKEEEARLNLSPMDDNNDKPKLYIPE